MQNYYSLQYKICTALGLYAYIFVTGPFFTDLYVIILDFVFLYYLLKNSVYSRNFFLKNYKIEFLILTLFWISSVISSIYSSDLQNSLIKSLAYIRFFIFSFSIIYFINLENNSNKLIKNLIYFISGIIFIVSISVFYEILIKKLFEKEIINFVFNQYQYGRYSGLFFEELIVGSFLSKIIVVYLLLISLKKKFSVFDYSTVFIGSLTVFLSGERMSTIMISMYLFFYILIFWKKTDLRLIVSLILIFILTFVIFLNTTPRAKERYLAFTQYIKENISLNKKEDKNSSYNYLALFKSGIHVWKTNKIFGVGVRNYRVECKKIHIGDLEDVLVNRYCDTHPHNIYSEILAETGLVGISLLIFFIIYSIYKSFQSKQLFVRQKLLSLLSISWVFWPLASTGSYFNNHNASILWFLIGIIFLIRDQNTNSKKNV